MNSTAPAAAGIFRMGGILSLWTWLEIGLVTMAGFAVQIALAASIPFDPRRVVVGRAFRLTGVVAARLSPFWRFGVLGAAPRAIAPRTVVVANHESQADPFLISHLPWEMKWLAKDSLFRIPFVGWSMRLAGDVAVRRGEADSGRRALERCAAWLRRGMPVMIFPEGTRSRTEELLPFKDGAFRLAIEQQADVLPLAVHGTRRALPKHSWRFGFTRALVTVGSPIATRGMTLADVESLKDMARGQILALRARLAETLSSMGRP